MADSNHTCKPCPFCGSVEAPAAYQQNKAKDGDPAVFVVYCDGGCGCEGPGAPTAAKARALWNRRSP